MWIAIGSWSVGFVLGYVAGLSKSSGTVSKVLGIIAGLIGGVAAWLKAGDQMGIYLTCIAIGFALGVTLGAIIRRKGIWDIQDPGTSKFMHEEASPWYVAIVKAIYCGLPIGLLFIWLIK